jgi:hypothetical protein
LPPNIHILIVIIVIIVIVRLLRTALVLVHKQRVKSGLYARVEVL